MTKTPKAHIDRDVSQVLAVAYAMRVECQTDAFLIRAALSDWVYSWTEQWDTWEGKRAAPDMNVEFELAWNPPTFCEIQWLVSKLEDCHVAAESLRPLQGFTGDRTSYEKLFASMTKPSAGTIKKANSSVQRTLKWLPVLEEALATRA